MCFLVLRAISLWCLWMLLCKIVAFLAAVASPAATTADAVALAFAAPASATD